MKYGLMGVAVRVLVKKPTLEYLREATPGISAKSVSSHYKAIVSRQPEVGGMRNNLIMGLYLAAYFMAVWQAAPEMMDDETFEGLVSHITVSKRFVKMNKGRDFFTKKNMETRDRLQSDPEFNSYLENWNTPSRMT